MLRPAPARCWSPQHKGRGLFLGPGGRLLRRWESRAPPPRPRQCRHVVTCGCLSLGPGFRLLSPSSRAPPRQVCSGAPRTVVTQTQRPGWLGAERSEGPGRHACLEAVPRAGLRARRAPSGLLSRTVQPREQRRVGPFLTLGVPLALRGWPVPQPGDLPCRVKPGCASLL